MRAVPLFMTLCLATPAFAQERTVDAVLAEQRAAEAEVARLESERAGIMAELSDLKARMSAISRDTDRIEAQADELEERIANLVREAGRMERDLADDRASILRLVAVLQRIEANPPPAIAAGESAIDSARAARLTSGVAAGLQARTRQLRLDIEELETVRAELQAERRQLGARTDELTARRAEMRQLSTDKTRLLDRLGREQAAQSARAERLAREAQTLRELLARVEAAAKAEPRIKPEIAPDLPETSVRPRLKPPLGGAVAARPLPEGLRFADARGQLSLPVRGRVTGRFSTERRGLSVETRGSAQVVSPYGGRIEFAGPFKNYERLVILNAGDGYFVVLTGLGTTFVTSGETVGAGEPLGEMPAGALSELYIEFRKDGRPVDPSPWLATRAG